MEGIESRQTLLAWTFLRANGVTPAVDIASKVLGVVVELPIDSSHDVLAAYADGSARYLNHGGPAIVIEDAGMTDAGKLIAATVELGQQLAMGLGTWEQRALPAVPPGHGRCSCSRLAGCASARVR